MRTLAFVLWYAGIAVKLIAACRMWRLGFVRRFPTVWIYIVASLLRSVFLVTSYGRALSEPVYVYSLAFMLLLEGFTIVGVFWAVAENYPLFRAFGCTLLAGSAAIGSLACWATRFAVVPSHLDGLWKLAILVQRYGTTVMVMVLAGSRILLPKVSNIPIRPSAMRASDILTVDAVLGLAGATAVIADGGQMVTLRAFAPVLKGVAVGSLWAFWWPLASDRCPTLAVTAAAENEAAGSNSSAETGFAAY